MDFYKDRKVKIGIYFFVSVTIIFLCVYNLSTLPIRLWDEGRVVENAFEMFLSHDFWVPTFDYKPEMWSTKPPLVLWEQCVSMAIFGVNEFAVRLPSAVMAILCAGLMMFILGRYTKNEWVGIIGALVLVTMPGYNAIHVIRTADYDATLVFFTTASLFSFWLFTEVNKSKYLKYFFLFLVLGVYTKGIQGLVLLPGILIYAIVYKKIHWFLKNATFYIYSTIALILSVGYYISRELVNSGYLKAVWLNELGGRFGTTIENHAEPFSFYWLNLKSHLDYWYIFLLLGCIFIFFEKDKKLQRILIFCFMSAFSYLLILSFAKTKIVWYDAPSLPFIAVIIAFGVYRFIALISSKLLAKIHANVLTINALLLFSLFIVPCYTTWKFINKNVEDDGDKETYAISNYLKSIEEGGPYSVHGYTMCYDGFNQHLAFYIGKFKSKNQIIKLKNPDGIEVGDTVLACQNSVFQMIENKYQYTSSNLNNGVRKIVIHNLRR